MKRIGTFLIAVALVVGMVGCGEVSDNGNGTVSYQLTVSSTAGGSVAEPSEGVHIYEEGTVVELEAVADDGYRFVNWTGNVGTVANVNAESTTITMDGNYSITANFVAQYVLTIDSTEGGEVTTPGEGTFTYHAGAVVGLIAAADVGYRFVEWTGDVSTIANRNSASTTITIEGECSVVAHFIEIVEYELTITSTIGGSVAVPGEGTFTYEEGAVVRLVATRSTGYQFANWTGDVGTVANVNAAATTITMNGDYSITANCEAEEPVVFVCPNLEASVREAVGIPNRALYPSDLKGLSELRAFGRSITDLTGLEHCSRLTWLELGRNQISDISPIAGLTKVTWINLQSNQISDISSLAGLTNLERLYLSSNQVSDVSSLANLTGLTTLSLSHNQIGHVSPLQDLKSLRHLYLDHNRITDISRLAGLSNLEEIMLQGNDIVDISPLANFISLTGLGLSGVDIIGAGVFINLSKLTRLYLEDGAISDISALTELTHLTELILSNNQISDISPLTNLHRLTRLSLSGNQISDISPLAALTNLTWILELHNNEIDDISPLASLVRLAGLGLSGNRISDISPLADLSGLRSLDLRHNQISDIAPLAGLTELRVLYLSANQISDITPLAGLVRLGDMWFPFAYGYPELLCLDLSNNQIADVSPLVANEGLSDGDYINLEHNPLSSQSINKYIPELQARGVIVGY